jgi:alanyl-tRNA synthetase
MKGAEVRRAFLRYFEARQHQIVASSSLVPDRDPTLLFVNAGMVPFKRTLLGEEIRAYTRAASSQKCMRVSGKHNDLEEVGRTPRHHTFFEMLGNFSFGDYFKEQAIGYAWEFLTEVLRLDPEQLVVSVLRGDQEAIEVWRDRVGLPAVRIYELGDSENFWAMGETGPCGPCSEIHVIRGPGCGRAQCDPSCGCGRFLEIWNLVFMQFARDEDGVKTPLPKPSIDTGMGLDRITSVLQDVPTNYDTDLFQPLIQRVAEIAGKRYGAAPESDVSMKVVGDHARACAFVIGDGVLPSNEGRGYVLRRVLRRAARHGVLLGVEEPFIHEVAGRVVDEMGEAYPELRERRAFIQDTIRREEERFLRTLGRGLSLLDAEVADARRARRRQLSGAVVFKLYDTFGFPRDLTEDILRGHDLDYDRDEFDAAMRQQSQRARDAWTGSGQTAAPEVYGALASGAPVAFVGYDGTEATSRVRALLVDGQRVERVQEGDRVELIADTTPFYAQSGGQVGDVGEIAGPSGRIAVDDTHRPVDGLIVHVGRVTLGSLSTGDEIQLQVDAETRAATMRNHSATHLFHWALRKVLGPQVQQAGSLVAPDRLRFDFTHDAPLKPDQIREIEDLVNRLVLANVAGRIVEKPYAQAIADGAIAIFEEKYAERVRVVSFGDASVELCGGTHVRATGDIGSFRVTSQAAVGSGVRRIEAQTGLGALEHARRESALLARTADLLRSAPSELPERVERLLERERELERDLEKVRAELLRGGSNDPLRDARSVGGVTVVANEVGDADPKELRALVDELKKRIGSGIVLLASRKEGKASLAMGVTKDLEGRFRAGDLIADVARSVSGKGGGRADFAQAGGPNVDGIPAALARVVELVEGAATS